MKLWHQCLWLHTFWFCVAFSDSEFTGAGMMTGDEVCEDGAASNGNRDRAGDGDGGEEMVWVLGI